MRLANRILMCLDRMSKQHNDGLCAVDFLGPLILVTFALVHFYFKRGCCSYAYILKTVQICTNIAMSAYN